MHSLVTTADSTLLHFLVPSCKKLPDITENNPFETQIKKLLTPGLGSQWVLDYLSRAAFILT